MKEYWSKAMLMNQKAKFDPVTFTSNGTWIVPRGIKQIAVDCVAAQGWNVYDGHGLGGRVQCILNVTPKEILYITVGTARTSAAQSVYNVSDIRTVSDDMNTRLIVAGGGGDYGEGWSYAGNGGGLIGESGAATYGVQSTAGTQSAGGNPNGTFGYGGLVNGRRGGDGWYGGGGGVIFFVSEHYGTAGAGGGSSYTHPTLCSDVIHTQGYQTGNGYITISMVE